MQKNKIIRYENIKELLYHSVTTYSSNIAFTTKTKNENGIKYINHTYSNFLDDINSFGTSLYKLGLRDKRIAVIGHNSYEWAISHLSNMLRWNGICSIG